jgi:hypothetical protein
MQVILEDLIVSFLFDHYPSKDFDEDKMMMLYQNIRFVRLIKMINLIIEFLID